MRRWRCPRAATDLNAKSWIELLPGLRIYVPNDTELLLQSDCRRKSPEIVAYKLIDTRAQRHTSPQRCDRSGMHRPAATHKSEKIIPSNPSYQVKSRPPQGSCLRGKVAGK